MGLLSDILMGIRGRIHFYIALDNKPAEEITLHDKEITAEIKNPLLALEIGFEELLSRERKDASTLKRIKSMGYKVKLKYKLLEFDL